jgi:prepilin-type N-terminal cleavage/methylation domain-containing protein
MRGFTLIELVVVFALIGLLSFGTYFSFRSYSQTQSMQNSVADVQQTLTTAKSRSLTQVKPTQCGTQILQGYQVSLSLPATYRLEVLCGTSTYQIDTKTLISPVTFAATSATKITFAVATGIVNTPGNLVLTGSNQTKTIRVDSAGTIATQ